ncbi:family 2 encapsulin nanocompartment cargo protein polyprenyl transferase [Spirillospora sp. CA-294931]|uniref:family 2 encapsulin nanocompartment cargo protein polyprenyl transferase n=1 Tax=Spirillospora sp. CA-294931 TaxID=3240042 RepID=UPI003D8BD6B7
MTVTQGGPRTARKVLSWSRGMLDPALRATVNDLPTSMRRIADYHFGWRDEADRPINVGGGKALRPALVLLTAEAVGGMAASALPAAVAIELTHNFSLLHDDVMDGDTTRRHRPTAWTVFGENAAILAGDALVAAAFEVLAASPHPATVRAVRILSSAVIELVEGQSADMSFETRTDVALPECLSMAGHKTGTLMGASTALGAAYGGGTDEQIEHMCAFGERLGLAFQVVDDLLGIWGDPAVTGKPVHSDLRNRKKSLPVVAALTSGTPAGAELADLYHRDEPFGEAEPARAAELIEVAGGRDWAVQRTASLLEEALSELAAATPSAPADTELTSLARLVAHRDH